MSRVSNEVKNLWLEFEDVPMNPVAECIETDWTFYVNGLSIPVTFSAGTPRKDIWEWFEKTFEISIADDLMGVEDEKKNRYGEDYIALNAYASLDDEDFEKTKELPEPPMATLFLYEPWLIKWMREHTKFQTLEEFLNRYTPDDIVGLQYQAEKDHAIAFAYIPSLDFPFEFYDDVRDSAFVAYTDLLSELMQNAGHTEASKWLDCLFNF